MEDVTSTRNRRPWQVGQRYAFIEQRLYWEGHLNRADLVNKFAISTPQASTDIASYMELQPEAIEYDKHRKVYVPTLNFSPRFMRPDARKYLTQLLLLADDALAPEESWLGTIPEHDAIPRVRRRLDATKLRPIVLAIHQRRSIEIVYQSMSSPEPTRRWIAPHALAFDGARWHARSWCFNKSMFNDFVLARIDSIESTKDATVDSSLDRAWHQFVTLKLGSHPKLSRAQRKAIELDYGMDDGSISVTMRLCMSYYYERHLGLDLDDAGLPAERCQVVLINRSEIEALRAEFESKRAD